MSRTASSRGRILIGHGLEDKHLRCGPTLVLFRRRVEAGGPRGDPEGVNLRLPPEGLQLSEMGRIVHLKNGEWTTPARHVDAAEPRVEHPDRRAPRPRWVGDRPP